MTITQQPHPFATAQASVGPASCPRAGFWRRCGAQLLDSIAINICSLPLAFFNNSWLSSAGFVIVYAAYYTSQEGGPNGQTPGKMALRIRVSDIASDASIGYHRAFIRCVGRIVSAIVFLLGYLWMLWDNEKQTWHDKMARSAVVTVSSYPGA
jgi:uncharacterized RDD family membrane protein YckC